MKIGVKIEGLGSVMAQLSGQAKQVRFATAMALTQTAHGVNAEIKDEMKRTIEGGPTAFALRAFKVAGATRDNLEATVALRTDSPEGGTSYTKALAHLFGGGRREWKKLEGFLRGQGLLPTGMMIAPGPKAPLDARGNMRRQQLGEMLKILGSQIRNLRIYRQMSSRGRVKKHAEVKGIGFFVIMPGADSHLAPGIWRRIETGTTSVVEPWIMYISPTAYRQKFDLNAIAHKVVAKQFKINFDKSLADALRTAR